MNKILLKRLFVSVLLSCTLISTCSGCTLNTQTTQNNQNTDEYQEISSDQTSPTEIENYVEGSIFKKHIVHNGVDVYLFHTHDGVDFTFSRRGNQGVFSCTYASQVLSSKSEEISEIAPIGIHVDMSYMNSIIIKIDDKEFVADAAQMCTDIEMLCDFRVCEDTENVFCPSVIVSAYLFCPECEQYVRLKNSVAIPYLKDKKIGYEGFYQWLITESDQPIHISNHH